MMDAALITELSRQGLLGLLLAISLTCIFILLRLLLAEKDKRIADANAVKDNISSPLLYMKDSLDLLQRKIEISKKAGKSEDY